MQADHTIKQENNLIKRRHSTAESRLAQVDGWKQSGLSMSEYCRKQGLALSSLSAWVQSHRRKSQFKPLNVKQLQSTHHVELSIVEIIAEGRVKIRLQNVTDAILVIEIAKGLMICNS